MRKAAVSIGIIILLLMPGIGVNTGGSKSTLFALQAQEPSLAGKWAGVLDVGSAKLHLGLDITQGAKGKLAAIMSVVEQGVTGLPIDSLTLTGDHLTFKIAPIGALYEGTFTSTRIEGAWSQGGHDLPLVFDRGNETAAATLRRPQDPTLPLPYNAEEVTVTNGTVALAGTFTTPQAGAPFSSLLLLTGSGPEDRNETVFGHKPFLVLSDYLTRAGFAVLRLDDRGIGKSTGEFKTAGVDEFTSDALAAVSWLKSRKDVDKKKIGIIGHSEGGAIAPLVAVRSSDVAFIVLMAAPGIPFDRLLDRQQADMMRAAGAPASMVTANRTLTRKVYAILREEPDSSKARDRLNQLVVETKIQLPELAATLSRQVPGVLSPEFRSLLAYSPAETLAKVRCPVLALNGSKDLQVSAEENLPGIAAALAAGRNPDVTTKQLPGLNHLFQTANTGALAEYGSIEETLSPHALAVIRDWLVAHSR